MANNTGQKFGGRKKGTPNKSTKEIREMLKTLVSNNIEQLDEDIKQLEPVQRIKAIIELSRFVIPTLKAVENTQNNIQNFTPVQIKATIINNKSQQHGKSK